MNGTTFIEVCMPHGAKFVNLVPGETTMEPLNKEHFGTNPLSFAERLSSSRRLKINYCYGGGVKKSVLNWEVVPFSEGPLSEVLVYSRINNG